MRVRKAMSDHMRTRSPIVNTHFINATHPIVPLIEAAAVKLAKLADVNRAVHTNVYNTLIAAAVVMG